MGKLLKYRPQRGLLADALAELVELEPTRESLAKHLSVAPASLNVYKYAYDNRIGWDTHVVCVYGQAVGFSDGPLRS